MKERVESSLGFGITDEQFSESKERAERKLTDIIKRFGDCNGARKEPGYLEELICEDVIVRMFSEARMLLAGNELNMEKEHLANCRSALHDTHIVAQPCN